MIASRPVQRRPLSTRARRWVRGQLFGSLSGSVFTVVTGVLVAFLLFSLLRFVFVSADWEVIEVNRRLIFLGRFPAGEEWRLWAPLWLSLALGGLAMGFWLHLGRRGVAVVAVVLAFLYTVLLEGPPALLFGGGVLLGAAGYVLTRYIAPGTAAEPLLRRATIGGLVLLIPLTWMTLQVAGGVRTSLWGGLMLNIMLATIGVAFGFPAGVLLALGRASSLPVIRWTATAYIELVRAGPLVTWLVMARFVLPDFLPPVFGLADLDIIVRAMIVLAGFTGAYVAEIVRGGLQSLPRGQHEAAHALGLNAFQSTWLIVLPQALRSVIPALVGQFISLWKDTTLVFVLGLTELLGAGRATLSQTAFIGRETEVFAFVALVFWVFSFSMSRLSQRIERDLGIGER